MKVHNFENEFYKRGFIDDQKIQNSKCVTVLTVSITGIQTPSCILGRDIEVEQNYQMKIICR